MRGRSMPSVVKQTATVVAGVWYLVGGAIAIIILLMVLSGHVAPAPGLPNRVQEPYSGS